jgi:hypothetical protein
VLQVEIKADGKVLHRFSQRFGFRQFEASGAHYNLNGIHFNLRGDNQQEADFGTDGYGIRPGFGPPTAGNAGWPQAVDNLLHLNFTIMRIHQIPATTYMLDVCDEKGLMLIEESPLRGSEGGENYKGGKDNMLNMDRELVLRDRNHPATAIWSAANEWSDPIKDAVKVIQSVDDTRPIIADGCGDMGAPYINIEHYCSGFNGVPDRGGHPRTDRPYGEGEAVWPRDNSRQGFAWMATGTRLRRLKGNADIRNYVLNNAWSNYVPGEDENNEVLEVKVKGSRDAKILPALADPWHDPNILLMQKCYNPLAVCDLDFDERNKRSNKNGDWPVSRPLIPSGARVTRTLALFNDELAGEDVQVSWELHSASKTGPIVKRGQFTLQIPLGEFRKWDIVFDTPPAPADLFLTVISSKNGQERFKDDLIAYKVGDAAGPLLKDGDYALINGSSGMAAEPGTYENKLAVVQQPVSTEPRQVWHLTHTSADEVTLTNKATGQVLGIDGESKENGALAVPEAGTGAPSQVWHVEALDETTFTFSNKATGKLLDVYGSSTTPGGRIVQWDTNGGANQTWQIAKK